MNTRSTETCISRDAISNDSYNDQYSQAPLIATNDEHLSLVTLVPDIASKFADVQSPARHQVSDRLFQQVLVGMGFSLLALVMVIATNYPEESLMQVPPAGPFIYQHLGG
jgi:hypothetical protein